MCPKCASSRRRWPNATGCRDSVTITIGSTRAWDGGEQEVLIRQEYSEEDDRAHIRYLLDEVFRDPRYIRVDGKPVFAVYRSALFPDMRRTIEVWREEAAARGVELYLCRVESFNAAGREELAVGFDAAIEFQPFTPAMTDFWEHRPWRQKLMYHLRKLWGDRRKMRKADYDTYVAYSLSRPAPDYKLYPSVTPSWDKQARRKQRMVLFHNATRDTAAGCARCCAASNLIRRRRISSSSTHGTNGPKATISNPI